MMRPIKEKLSCIVALTVVGNLWLFYFPWTGLAIMSWWKYTSCLSVCLSVVVILHPRTRCTASTTCSSTDCYGFCIPMSKLFLINELLGWASCWQSGRRQHVLKFWRKAFRRHSKLTNQYLYVLKIYTGWVVGLFYNIRLTPCESSDHQYRRPRDSKNIGEPPRNIGYLTRNKQTCAL